MKVLIVGAVAVVVGDKCAVLVLAEGQRQALEALCRAVPDELVGQVLDRWALKCLSRTFGQAN